MTRLPTGFAGQCTVCGRILLIRGIKRRSWSSSGTGRLQSMEGFTNFDLYSVSPSLVLVPMRPRLLFAAQLTPGSYACACFDSDNQEDGHGVYGENSLVMRSR
jgi:hypothetical protein